jgi:hypothetical protein
MVLFRRELPEHGSPVILALFPRRSSCRREELEHGWSTEAPRWPARREVPT